MSTARLIDSNSDGPKKIDRYDLVAQVASGGMATVYLGRLSGVGGFQRFVAIKRLHPHLADEEEFVQMFLDEARLAAGIHHPNVVPILEVGASHVGYYLVMDYIEGDTLARLLGVAAKTRSPLPSPIAVRIMLDMLAGLHAAHELRDQDGNSAGLVHRDVSPQNILVGLDGTSRITDFGVARAASRLSATRAGQLKGKVAYMAPEQASNDPQVDRRADIFSSGVVLWEALAGRRLFKAQNEVATLNNVLSAQVQHVSDVNPTVARAVGDVCMMALQRDPARRFQDCASFAAALEAAALKTGQLALGRDVAAHVVAALGDEIKSQREAVREWISRSQHVSSEGVGKLAPLPPPAVPKLSLTPSGAMELSPTGAGDASSSAVYPPRGQATGSRRALVVGASIALAGIGGALALVGVNSRSDEGPAPALQAASPLVSSAPVAAPSPAPSQTTSEANAADDEKASEPVSADDVEEAETDPDPDPSAATPEAAKPRPARSRWTPRRTSTKKTTSKKSTGVIGNIDENNPYK